MDAERLRQLREKIFREPALARVLTAVSGAEREALYLVGGALRDFCLGREQVPDLDFVFDGDVARFCGGLAEKLSARSVVLDERWGIIRLVVRAGGALPERLTLDFSAMQGGGLRQDLARRDFTCNAMALRLAVAPESDRGSGWVDPFGGLEDLGRKTLRVVRGEAFREDPLRLLRAFRLSASLGLRIEGDTLARIREERERIRGSAAERVHDELLRLLDCPASHALLVAMDRCGLMDAVIPEIRGLKGLAQGRYHRLDGWAHTLETVRLLEKALLEGLARTLPGWSRAAAAWLDREPRTRALLKMAALLHDVGKPSAQSRDARGEVHFFGHERMGARIAEGVMERLRMSRADTERVRTWVRYHMGPVHMTQALRLGKLSGKARLRFVRRVGKDAPGVLVLSRVDVAASGGAGCVPGWTEAHREVVDSLFRLWGEQDAVAGGAGALVDGRTLMAELGLPPGPHLGRLLRLLEEARVLGRIRDRSGALALARTLRKGLGDS